jgi:hypothetical protein
MRTKLCDNNGLAGRAGGELPARRAISVGDRSAQPITHPPKWWKAA